MSATEAEQAVLDAAVEWDAAAPTGDRDLQVAAVRALYDAVRAYRDLAAVSAQEEP